MIAGSRSLDLTADAVRELAEFVSRTGIDHVPASTLSHAQLVFADTVAVAIDGSRRPEVGAAYDSVQGSGHSVVLRPGFPLVQEWDAALLNSLAICGTELDEGVRPTGHPAAHVVAPTLASAQASGRPGSDFVVAMILGYEVQARIARATRRLRGNVHCHGNLGHAGVAAGLARLDDWPSARVGAAMNAAAGFASATSYSLPFHGATIHSATPALSGMVGLLVRRLIGAGFTAFDGSVGEVFGEILGDQFDPAALVDGLGNSWAIDEGYVKFHAACGHAHAALDAAGDALGGFVGAGAAYPRQVGIQLDPDEVESVEVRVSRPAYVLAHQPPAEVALAARFSIPFSIATFLTHGRASAEVFEDPWLQDRRVWALADRVHLVIDEGFTDAYPDLNPSAVRIQMRDGRVLDGRCTNPYGNPVSQASDEHVRQKFLGLTSATLSASEATALWQASISVSELADMRDFTVGL